MTRRDVPWPAGTPCWTDLSTSDPLAARGYYEALFDWRVRVGGQDAHGFAIATVGGDDVAGVHGIAAADPLGWITYLATDDIAATAAAVTAAGGGVDVGPVAVPGRGHLLIGHDPSGTVFGAWQADPHPGATRVNEPGALVWSELQAPDADAAQAFYGAVFGVTFTEIGGDAFRFATMEVDGATVGGIGALGTGDAAPYWRLYFGAADVDATVAASVAMRGRVLVESHDTPFGRWAQLADPQGVPYCVITPPA